MTKINDDNSIRQYQKFGALPRIPGGHPFTKYWVQHDQVFCFLYPDGPANRSGCFDTEQDLIAHGYVEVPLDAICT